MRQDFDSNFIEQLGRTAKRQAAAPAPAGNAADPEFKYRRGLANISEAVMVRVVELETQAADLLEIAKKLRAAVVANT